MAPIVGYDRAGLGRSEWDGTNPTPRHVADRLRRVLQEIGAGPPYVLVGFSWGGILARYFAGYYPADVVGIVLVDPAPMVTESLADNLSPFEKIGAGRAGFDSYWSSFSALLAQASPAVRAENRVLRGLLEMDLAARDLRPVPAVPMALIVAAKYFAVPLAVPLDLQQHSQADLRYRLRVLSEWVLASPHGTGPSEAGHDRKAAPHAGGRERAPARARRRSSGSARAFRRAPPGSPPRGFG